MKKTSRLHRLQAQTIPDAGQQIGQKTPIMQNFCNPYALEIRIPKNSKIIISLTVSTISNRFGLEVP